MIANNIFNYKHSNTEVIQAKTELGNIDNKISNLKIYRLALSVIAFVGAVLAPLTGGFSLIGSAATAGLAIAFHKQIERLETKKLSINFGSRSSCLVSRSHIDEKNYPQIKQAFEQIKKSKTQSISLQLKDEEELAVEPENPINTSEIKIRIDNEEYSYEKAELNSNSIIARFRKISDSNHKIDVLYDPIHKDEFTIIQSGPLTESHKLTDGIDRF